MHACIWKLNVELTSVTRTFTQAFKMSHVLATSSPPAWVDEKFRWQNMHEACGLMLTEPCCTRRHGKYDSTHVVSCSNSFQGSALDST